MVDGKDHQHYKTVKVLKLLNVAPYHKLPISETIPTAYTELDEASSRIDSLVGILNDLSTYFF